MRWIVLALLVACGRYVPTTRVSGTGDYDPRIEIRIDNRNWNMARVYIRSAYSESNSRIATVTSLRPEVVMWRPSFNEFVLRVTFLASSEVWESQVLYDNETCFSLVIENALQHSYAIPCYT